MGAIVTMHKPQCDARSGTEREGELYSSWFHTLILRDIISKRDFSLSLLDISERSCQLHVQEPDSGLFVSTQCDDSDKCWCVDTVTGNELYGTRSLQIQSAFNVCASELYPFPELG
jgi:hypothetical protein